MTGDSQGKAFAIFGSAARGDIDVFSDRDLLVVSDDEVSLRAMKRKYDSAGWSCTAYSWNRLQRAADYGSLFVQHLKQESKILSDPSNRLADLLDQYSANADYKNEWAGASSLVRLLTQHLPQCDAGPMWAMDVLSVGFRSLAVANLADHGIYAFSNSGIIEGLSRIGIVETEDKHQLSDLRRFKSLYRRGIINTQANWSVVFDRIRLIDKIFGLGLSPARGRIVEIIELALAKSDYNQQSNTDWYTKCRRVESALWMLKPRQDRERHEFLERRASLLKIVKAPNVYAWHFTGGYESLQDNLFDLTTISAV